MNRKIIIIVGPTAVGKTEYAIKAAQDFNGEIVSADSMQLYKFMDIGSAKPTSEEQAAARHYLVDEIDPRDDFSVAEYSRLAKKYMNMILSDSPFLVWLFSWFVLLAISVCIGTFVLIYRYESKIRNDIKELLKKEEK